MNELIKTLYLCSGKRQGMSDLEPSNGLLDISIIDSDGSVTVVVPLIKSGEEVDDKLELSLFLLPEGKKWWHKNPVDFTWEMQPYPGNLVAPFWFVGVRVTAKIPEGCDWLDSKIATIGGQDKYLVEPPTGPWDISESREETVKVADWNIDTILDYLVPGDLISITHRYHIADDYTMPYQYFRTSALYGGKVISRQAHYAIENLLMYNVECEGHTFQEVLPTDYFLYDVDDDVYLLAIRDDSTDTSRTNLTPDFDVSATVRLLPMSIDSRGPASSSISYTGSDFERYANMRILTMVISGDPAGNNTATVVNDLGTFNNVPIKYHCVGQYMTDGWRAFRNGDAVLVLWDGYRSNPSSIDMTIVGHVGSVLPCGSIKGILAYLLSIDGSDPQTWLFASGYKSKPQVTPLGGNNYWSDGSTVIAWNSPGGRYASGSNNGGPDIYQDGKIIASRSGISGAALRSGGTQVIVVSSSGDVWVKQIGLGLPTENWTRIYINNTSVPTTAVSFNSDATAAIGIATDLTMEYTISGNSVTKVDGVSPGIMPENQARALPKSPIAVDYKGNEKVILYKERFIIDGGTPIIELSDWESYDPNPEIDPPRFRRRTVESWQNFEYADVLSIGDAQYTIQRQRDEIHDPIHYQYSNAWNTISDTSSTITDNWCLSGVIVGLDLRAGFISIYHREYPKTMTYTNTVTVNINFSSFTSTYESVDESWDPQRDLKRYKKIWRPYLSTSEIVSSEYQITCPELMAPLGIQTWPGDTVDHGYKFGSGSTPGFDDYYFVSGQRIEYTGVIARTIDPYHRYMYDFQYIFSLKSTIQYGAYRSTSLLSWKLSNEASYIEFSDSANLAGYTGMVSPVYASNVLVVP